MERTGTKLIRKDFLRGGENVFYSKPLIENKYVWIDNPNIGRTEPMTKTVTTKIERTADDILEELEEGTYMTKDKSLIVGSRGFWNNSLIVFANPHQRDPDVILTEQTLQELTDLIDLKKASVDIKGSESELYMATRRLNREGE